MKLGRCIDTYWTQKKMIAPGCEPLFVAQLMDRMSPFVHGQSLTGAGGGGFYFGLLKDASARNQAESMITSMQVSFFSLPSCCFLLNIKLRLVIFKGIGKDVTLHGHIGHNGPMHEQGRRVTKNVISVHFSILNVKFSRCAARN